MVIKATIVTVLFAEMYVIVNVVFVIRCLYSAVNLTLVDLNKILFKTK